VIKMNKLIEKD